jgi:hypothetical protein
MKGYVHINLMKIGVYFRFRDISLFLVVFICVFVLLFSCISSPKAKDDKNKTSENSTGTADTDTNSDSGTGSTKKDNSSTSGEKTKYNRTTSTEKDSNRSIFSGWEKLSFFRKNNPVNPDESNIYVFVYVFLFCFLYLIFIIGIIRKKKKR